MNIFDIIPDKGGERVAVKGEHYVVFTDRNGVETKVINLNNPAICRTNGIIELEPVRRSSRHENYMSFSRIFDTDNDIVIGIPKGQDKKTGEIMFERISVREEEVFDLSKNNEAKRWAILQFHKDVDLDGSKTRGGMKPKYKVYDKEKEAEVFHAERNIKRKAEAIAEGLGGTPLRDFALTIGINVDVMSIAQCSMQVIQYAEKYPKKFMDAWLSPTRHETAVLKKALSLGILTQNSIDGICYNSLPLGMYEQQAVQYLKDNTNTCTVIEQQIVAKDTKRPVELKNNKVVEILDEKDAENIRLKAQLEALEKRLADVSKAKVDEIVNKTAQTILSADEELKGLQAEAKEAGVRNSHVIKNKDLLRKKIAEVKVAN